MKSGKHRPVTLFLCLLFFQHLHAINHPRIIRLGVEKGLSNNSIRNIFQDRDGFIWLGTSDGLNRFDGYEFKVFRNKIKDPFSLPHNYICAVNQDQQHTIYIGSGQGLCRYNNLTSAFSVAWFFPYGLHKPKKITSTVNYIEPDKTGNLFIGTNGSGLMIKWAGADTAVQIPLEYKSKISADYYVAVKIDNRQRVWLFVDGYGLFQYDYTSKRIRLINDELKNTQSLVADHQDNLWMGTANGLYKYSIIENRFVKIYTTATKLTSNNISCLSFDQKGDLWIGTYGGVNILNVATDHIDYILYGENKQSLPSPFISAIYHDKESRHWIGTLKGGVNIIDPYINRFQTISRNPSNSNTLPSNFVASLFEDGNGDLFIGTDGGGLSIWDRRLNHFRNFKHNPLDPHSISDNKVTGIVEDHLKNIWVGTYGGGINKCNKAAGTFERFKCIDDVAGIENGNIWQLYQDRENTLWATTYGNGRLYRFNYRQNRFEVFDRVLHDLLTIFEDKNGVLWAGNGDHLIRIDRKGHNHVFYEMGKPVRAIQEDSRGNFWIGTEGAGIILFDRVKGTSMAQFSDADGLCSNSVLNILEDKQGDLWLSTFNGLSRFNPANKRFTNFYLEDGVQGNHFFYMAARRLRSYEMAFGGINGLTLFSPEKIVARDYMPAFVITGLRLNNKQLSDDSCYIEEVKDNHVAAIRIPWHHAVLSVDFAALEYSLPGKIMYGYYLEGWDKGWNYLTNSRTAHYSNLREGHYVLHIKSTNADGKWNDRETVLKITVLPPWFRSWWAYLLYLSAAAGILFGYLRYRTHQIRLEYQVQQERQLNEKKAAFFISISHEFRTPLTLVLNHLKDLLKKTQASAGDEGEIKIVYNNARRMLRMVDQLLLFQKADNDLDKLKISGFDMSRLVKNVYASFTGLAKIRKINYQLQLSEVNTDAGATRYADQEKLEIILYNLLSNAFKYTPENGTICFNVRMESDAVVFEVQDTGTGIPDSEGKKIFEKFYQYNTAATGFGIGLFLVKHFVYMHKGTLHFTSEEGKGTLFSVQLPTNRKHFAEHDMAPGIIGESAFFEDIAEEEPDPSVTDQNPQTAMAPVTSERQSILVVDDDFEMREYISQMFNNQFIVYQAQNGEEGLQVAYDLQPDVIISDIAMPGKSGIEFCQQLKSDSALAHIPFILLTGKSSSDTRLTGVEVGADDYITKPFDKDLLIARVTALLKSRNSLQRYFYNEITLQQNPLKVSAEYKEFLDSCIVIVEKHLYNDQFTVMVLAAELGMSYAKMNKKIKEVSGQPANAFVRFIKLRKAAELFINTNKNINETAFLVGIKDIKHFREHFTKLFGMKPSEYIDKYRKPLGKQYNLNEKIVKRNDY